MSEYTVDGWNNFCRVFKLPETFPSDFCFGGGIPVEIKMVDWFNPIPMSQPGVSKEVWLKEVGEIETKTVSDYDMKNIITPFLRIKNYIEKGRKYLVIFDFGCTFMFEG